MCYICIIDLKLDKGTMVRRIEAKNAYDIIFEVRVLLMLAEIEKYLKDTTFESNRRGERTLIDLN